MEIKKALLLSAALLMLLAGCATSNKTLYCWGNYEGQLYEHFKGEAPEKEIVSMESMMNQCRDSGEKLPPGFYAHLGLLYEHAGKPEEAREMLALEKQNFPESAHFIDNLNDNFEKASSQ